MGEGAAAAAQADAHTAASVRRSRRKRKRGGREGREGAEGGEGQRRTDCIMPTALEVEQWPTRLKSEGAGGCRRGANKLKLIFSVFFIRRCSAVAPSPNYPPPPNPPPPAFKYPAAAPRSPFPSAPQHAARSRPSSRFTRPQPHGCRALSPQCLAAKASRLAPPLPICLFHATSRPRPSPHVIFGSASRR